MEPDLRYRRIPGTLLVEGRAPDGDSLRFRPDDPGAFDGLPRAELAEKSREDGAFQLRLEGLDAPELHYEGLAQPLAEAARAALLAGCRFTRWRFGEGGRRVIEARPREVRATVFARACEAHGRPVAYVVPGGARGAVREASVGPGELRETVNLGLLAQGSAYPLFYSSMPEAHRELFREAAEGARAARKGVWRRDRTRRFRLERVEDIAGPGAQLVWPKVFRRAVGWLRDREAGRFGGGFGEWLRAGRGEDDRCVVEGRPAHLAALLLHIESGRVGLDIHAGAVVWHAN